MQGTVDEDKSFTELAFLKNSYYSNDKLPFYKKQVHSLMFQMKHRIKMTLCGGNAIFYMATDLHGFQKESILSKLYYKRLINLSSSNRENTLENFEISIFPPAFRINS
ncbi:hypothetical protein T03_10428 [Trichinella britovi]|uniref:Uncharacterized protein n=1 Tax=Trichinella britovi TaxID=45882 RepID=A0A0V1CMN7_TRIBR|nr:hypothetical protein T03_10428 [Trichinella britovi]